MIKLDHLTIAVSDCEKSRDWYMETLGLKLEFEIPERRTSAVQDEFGFTLFLAETPGGPGRPSCVLTFQVSNVETKHRELVAAGVKFGHPPQKTFWGYGAELTLTKSRPPDFRAAAALAKCAAASAAPPC